MKNSKVFLVNGVPRTRPPKQPSPALSVLPSMTVGAWGDPHLYVNVNSLDGQSRLQAKTIAKLGDNKAGSSGNNEIKLLDLQTATDTVKIYYTNKIWANNAKVVDSVRVEYNGASATYTNSTRVTLGPINLYILKRTVSGNDYLSFEINWSKITNITKLAGAIVVILKRVADSNGVLWNGGDGASWDGLGKAASVFGLSRSSFETGIGIQSVEDELFLSEDQANFIEIVSTDFVQDSNIFDNLENLGANGEGDGAHVADWDDTHSDIVTIFSSGNGLIGYVTDNVSPISPPSGTTTTTTTTTTTAAPTTTTTTTEAPSGALSGAGNVLYVSTVNSFDNGEYCDPTPSTIVNDLYAGYSSIKSWMLSNGWESVTYQIFAPSFVENDGFCDFYTSATLYIYGKPQSGKSLAIDENGFPFTSGANAGLQTYGYFGFTGGNDPQGNPYGDFNNPYWLNYETRIPPCI